MGLDMYLMKKIPNNENMELIYWRKANQVFDWFNRNCANNAIENCVPVPVSTYDLTNLLKDVNAVLEDNSKSEELLPTTDGFFFGSTDYNEWYFDDLKYTKEKLEEVLCDITEDDELEFYAWW